jgi:hypothetical protein
VARAFFGMSSFFTEWDPGDQTRSLILQVIWHSFKGL